MFKKISFPWIVVIFILLILVSFTSVEAKTYNIKLGTVWPADHPTSKAIEEVFIPYVEEESDGAISITHYPNFQLGSERALGESAMTGAIEMVAIGNLIMTVIPELKIPELPFMWEDGEEAFKALYGDFGEVIREKMAEKGLVNIAWTRRGFRQITSVKPIKSLDDLKGFKLRLPEVDYYVDMAKALGAIPAVIAWPEVYTALEQGVVDGQENPIETIYSMKFYEVQPYLALTKHIFTFGQVMANKKFWDSLPLEMQTIILDGAEKTRIKQSELIDELNNTALDHMRDKGVIITEPDRKPFIEATKCIKEDFVKNNPWAKELFQMLGKI